MSSMVIHIGQSKTGTTTLQRAVFENHSQLHYLGKIYRSEYERQCVSSGTFDFLAPLLWRTDQPWDEAVAKKFFAGTLLPRAGSKTILGSWEGLGQQPIASFETSLDRLTAACGTCRLLISLRNPISRLPSMYLQHLRGNQKQLAGEYITFDEWLDSETQRLGSLERVFAYREYVELAIGRLGADNVGVFVYEQFDADPQEYLRLVSDFLGIDAQETVKLAEGQRLHTRLYASQVEKMEKINTSLLGRLRWRLASPDKRKELVGFSNSHSVIHTSVANDVPASAEMSEETAQRVSDAARPGNRWLVENLGLDLEAYGYPL